MKRLFCSAQRRNRRSFALLQKSKNPLILCSALFIGLVMSSCKKNGSAPIATEEIQTHANSPGGSNGFGTYTGLLPETISELQQAKIATAKYNNFDNAIRDGYVDINVIVPEMGYHYLKAEYLDGTFEYGKPEILVYNKEENGKMKLVAVEYAVPLSLSANAPSGYTGDNDQWSVYQGVLWTLHAWIWEYNPAGVFNPTNPEIHVH